MAKLTLRDLFAVVTIVALALGWWLNNPGKLPQTAAAAMALFTIGLTVSTVVWALSMLRRKASVRELIAVAAIWCIVSAFWGAFLAPLD